MKVCEHACDTTWMWRSEGKLWELILSYHVGSGDRTQAVGMSRRHLYVLTHLSVPLTHFLNCHIIVKWCLYEVPSTFLPLSNLSSFIVRRILHSAWSIYTLFSFGEGWMGSQAQWCKEVQGPWETEVERPQVWDKSRLHMESQRGWSRKDELRIWLSRWRCLLLRLTTWGQPCDLHVQERERIPASCLLFLSCAARLCARKYAQM